MTEFVVPEYKDLFARDSEWDLLIRRQIVLVTRRARLTREEMEDQVQDVRLRLMSGRVLEKFVESKERNANLKVTTLEACDRLGITYKDFEWLHWAEMREGSGVGWVPQPLEGHRLSRHAIYSMDDINAMAAGLKAGQPVREKGSLKLHFKRYLTRAIRNHQHNYGRTERRKHQDKAGAVDPYEDCFMTLSATTPLASSALERCETVRVLGTAVGIDLTEDHIRGVLDAVDRGAGFLESMEAVVGVTLDGVDLEAIRQKLRGSER